MANHKESGLISDHKVAVGVGLAALAAAAAGAYYLYGNERGPERRRKLKSWMLRMKADVLEQIETLKEVNEEAYKTVVDGISEKYRQLKDIDPSEVAALATRMKAHWKDIQKDISSATSGKTARSSSGSQTNIKKARTVKARKVNSSGRKKSS